MTTEFDGRSSGSAPAQTDSDAQVCPACQHDLSIHDATATRYCKASQDRGLDRRCMCPGRAAADAAKARAASTTPTREDAPMYGRGRFSGK
jgi:hypothetical protein